MKITVVGLGYVGLSNAVLLAQHHNVRALEIDKVRADLINSRCSPIDDAEISAFLADRDLDLQAMTSPEVALPGAEFVIIATPTNYDSQTNRFDTSSVEAVIALARRHASEAVVVVKSTVPVGGRNTALMQSCSRLSSCVKGGPFTTTCTPRASS